MSVSRASTADSAAARSPWLVGCDVVDVGRIGRALARPGFADRVFTSRERADATRGGVEPGTAPHLARLAARFAAKEAARKALGDLRLPFHATEIRTAADGAPQLWVDGAASALSVSLSHDGGVAMAVVAGRRPPPNRRRDTRNGAHDAAG